MFKSGGMTAATFKPWIDRSTAQDGAPVVLWADAEELVALRFECGFWVISRRPALRTGDGAGARFGLQFRGVSYAESGAEFARLGPDADLAEWQAAYDDCYQIQMSRCRSLAADRAGPTGAVQVAI